MAKGRRGSRCQMGGAGAPPTMEQQMVALKMETALGPANPNAMNATMIKGGRKRSAKRGGSGLVEVLVPAALVYANQSYKPKNATVSFRRRRSQSRHTRNNRLTRRR